MARMYPERLPAQINSDAERKLFNQLQNNLPADYNVMWHIPLTVPRPVNQGGIEDIEIDFLVLHPQYGILVLEVKGGGIGFLASMNQWYTKNRKGEYINIKDPFEQARKCMHTLLRQHRERNIWISTIGYAVVFPDISEKDADTVASLSNMPRKLILDRQKVESTCIQNSLIEVYNSYKRKGATPPDADMVNIVIDSYKRSWSVPSLLLNNIQEEKESLAELTEQQFVVLDTLSNHSRAAIYGFAGTGKTFLALEKSRRLARQGLNVLLTCYNTKLADSLRKQIKEEANKETALNNIHVRHFHGLVKEYCVQAMLTAELSYDDDSYPEALLKATQSVNKRFDAILVDEGQDFKKMWWEALEALLNSKAGLLYIFFDDNQNIYEDQPWYPVPPEHHYPLNHNCRATVKIHQFMMEYHDRLNSITRKFALAPQCKGPEGREVEFIDLPSLKHGDEQTKLVKLLDRLTQSEQIPIENIVLLTPSSKQKSRFHYGPIADGRYRLNWGNYHEANALTCSTIHGFKGLERDVVIVAELDKLRRMRERDKLMYVALSRARLHLIILGDTGDPFTIDLADLGDLEDHPF